MKSNIQPGKDIIYNQILANVNSVITELSKGIELKQFCFDYTFEQFKKVELKIERDFTQFQN